MLKITDSDVIKDITAKHKISKSKLASSLNMSRQYLQRISTGERKFSCKALLTLRTLYPEYFSDDIKIEENATKEELNRLRRSLNLTREQFAQKLGISLTLLTKYESGARKISKFSMMKLNELVSPAKRSLSLVYCPEIHIPVCEDLTALNELHSLIEIDKLILDRHGINPYKSYVMSVEGNSLLPDFKDGDLVILDTSKTTPIPNTYYLLKNKTEIKCTLCKECTLIPDEYEVIGAIPRVIL